MININLKIVYTFIFREWTFNTDGVSMMQKKNFVATLLDHLRSNMSSKFQENMGYFEKS